MAIYIYNSESQKKEEFKSFHPNEVRMYVCGPTVYDFVHVGNFRGAIFFNLVRNWFEKRGFKVTYVYNYTDVDDKIINRAQKEGVESQEISERFIGEFCKDYESLGLRPQSKNPRVTEYMNEIIQFVSELIERKKAYVADGDVYFDVHEFEPYGRLSHKKLEDLESGYRIEVDSRKKHPADFALWKKAKPGEPHWSSPWSEGRPGWHIECSAMARALLGDSIDIHGGGLDLIFPHHENEVAQSEGCTGKPFVRYWMHNNMIEFGNQKMSKSLGNVTKARDFIESQGAELFKFLILSVHYRSILDFSDQSVENALANLARFYSSLAFAKSAMAESLPLVPVPEKFQKAIDEASDKWSRALDDDFNTPEAMTALYEVMRLFNQLARTPGKITPEKKALAEVFYHWMRSQGALMALFQEEPVTFLRDLDDRLLAKRGLRRTEVDQLVAMRSEARQRKDFAESDRLRAELGQMGIAVQDSAQGTDWEVQK